MPGKVRSGLGLAGALAGLNFAGQHHVPHAVVVTVGVPLGIALAWWLIRVGRPRPNRGELGTRALLDAGRLLRGRAASLALTSEPARVRSIVQAGAVQLAGDLSRASKVAGELPPVLASQVNDAVGRARGLSRALSRGGTAFQRGDAASLHALAGTLGRAATLSSRDRALSRDPAGRALISYLTDASTTARAFDARVSRARARELAASREKARAAALARRKARVRPQRHARDAAPRVGRLMALAAGRLTTLAAWLLPASDRGRYAEEYQSELREIGRGSRPARRQLLYALCLLRATPWLCMRLRTSRRRDASSE
jgi:hypothetical protein